LSFPLPGFPRSSFPTDSLQVKLKGDQQLHKKTGGNAKYIHIRNTWQWFAVPSSRRKQSPVSLRGISDNSAGSHSGRSEPGPSLAELVSRRPLGQRAQDLAPPAAQYPWLPDDGLGCEAKRRSAAIEEGYT